MERVLIEPRCCSFNREDVLQNIYDRFVSQEYAQMKEEEKKATKTKRRKI